MGESTDSQDIPAYGHVSTKWYKFFEDFQYEVISIVIFLLLTNLYFENNVLGHTVHLNKRSI